MKDNLHFGAEVEDWYCVNLEIHILTQHIDQNYVNFFQNMKDIHKVRFNKFAMRFGHRNYVKTKFLADIFPVFLENIIREEKNIQDDHDDRPDLY